MIGDRVSSLVPITGPVNLNPLSQVITIHLEIDREPVNYINKYQSSYGLQWFDKGEQILIG